MADHLDFDAEAYLQHFTGVNEHKGNYMLDHAHIVFQNLREKNDVKVLEFGSGPVIQNCISAAAFASEIVFCDIAPANREAIQKWLDGDADAFNWSPFFDYVVKTLEGKGEKEAREREERMRRVSRVVYCDALSKTPLAKDNAGPYDVIIQCACLQAACADKASFEKAFRVLISYLKPGGWLIDGGFEPPTDMFDVTYNVGGKDHHCIRLTADSVARVMRECGFQDVETKFASFDPEMQYLLKLTSRAPLGFHAVTGRKC